MRARLPGQNKKQREGLALLTATMLDVRSANLTGLAASLPRAAERLDMRYQRISRLLGFSRTFGAAHAQGDQGKALTYLAFAELTYRSDRDRAAGEERASNFVVFQGGHSSCTARPAPKVRENRSWATSGSRSRR